MSSKKAFDTNYTSNPVFAPEALCIVGGKCLPADEQGPLDTAHTSRDVSAGGHDLYDHRLVEVQITDASVANIDYLGVLQNVVIRKDPVSGVPMVVAGRGRVRRARKANILRRARGMEPIEITCTIERPSKDDPGRLLSVMIAENAVRDDDSPLAKLEKAKALMATGVGKARAAVTFGLDPEYFEQLLAYDDNATPEVKAAVAGGEMSPTAGVEMVKAAKSPEAQNKALATVRATTKAGKQATVRAAVNAAKVATGKITGDNDAGLIPSRRELGAVLKHVSKLAGPEADEARVLLDDVKIAADRDITHQHLVDAFYIGVEAALKLGAGKCDDATLLAMLKKARKELAK